MYVNWSAGHFHPAVSRRITATVNNGGADLRISTVSGDVRLAHN